MIKQVTVMNKPLLLQQEHQQQQSLKDGPAFNQTTNIKDSSGNLVKVPGGFKVSSDSANNVADGVVIEDSNQNQYVWIPVKSASDLDNNNSYPVGSAFASGATRYSAENWNQTGWSDLDANFVVKAGGFYVGRFETGWTNKMVIKKGVDTYRSMSLNTAISQAGKVYQSSTARTNLILGVCWDAVMKFVHNKRAGDNSTYNVTTNINRCSLYEYEAYSVPQRQIESQIFMIQLVI